VDDSPHLRTLPAWPAADEAELGRTCAAIARRLSQAQAPARIVGWLPVVSGVNLGPFLVRLAVSLSSFAGGQIGVVPRWRSWAKDPGGATGDASSVRLREMAPGVVAIVPAPCPDSRAAALALQPALWSLPAGIVRVLVDLSGYTADGVLPPGAGKLVDGIALAVPARQARRQHVAALLRAIPPGKSLGAILVG
jgi:hypothetical protein